MNRIIVEEKYAYFNAFYSINDIFNVSDLYLHKNACILTVFCFRFKRMEQL